MTHRRALILGVTGQDGAYLAQHLLTRGYAVYGGTRDPEHPRTVNLEYLGVQADVTICNGVLDSVGAATQLLEQVHPDEIYNLAGQTSVGKSFIDPCGTYTSFAVATIHILEAMRILGCRTRLFNAGSSECFGSISDPADEETPHRPLSPYAAGKSAACFAVSTYRQAYGLYAVTGFLFNHESPLRSPSFVTHKIVTAVCNIAAGERHKLVLGNLDVWRDWGWAPEYVEVMQQMLQLSEPEDLVIATGETHSLEEFVRLAFAIKGLDYREHTEVSDSLTRKSDIRRSAANVAKARRLLNWSAKCRFPTVVARLVESTGPLS